MNNGEAPGVDETPAGTLLQRVLRPEKWPKALNFLKPLGPVLTEQGVRNYIVKCECGRVRWLICAPHIRRHHEGHESKPCIKASMWTFIKAKNGWLDNRTLSEWFADFIAGEKVK